MTSWGYCDFAVIACPLPCLQMKLQMHGHSLDVANVNTQFVYYFQISDVATVYMHECVLNGNDNLNPKSDVSVY
jgi:hypothetical protein